MPDAIFALRSHPRSLLLAAVLLLCGLLVATGSVGSMIMSGGEGDGSGIGGTGKSGDFGGSGFGGTGSSNPFFGVTDEETNPDIRDYDGGPLPDDGLPHNRTRPETAVLPDLMIPLNELSRLLQEPVPETLIEPPEPALDAAPAAPTVDRRPTRELFNTAELAPVPAPVEIQLTVPENLADELADDIEPYRLELANEDSGENIHEDKEESRTELAEHPEADTEAEQSLLAGDTPQTEAADIAAGTQHTESAAEETRVNPERIQRPELPPFQRVRPVERASVAVPRPAPMRI